MEPEQLSIGITVTGQPVHFSREERERHVYVVGKSGSGKSTVLFNLAMLDIMAGKGVAIIDPHGDLAETIADCLPRNRTDETCYLDVTDTEWPVGFNPIAGVAPARRALAASGIVSAFKHLWADSWGPRLEHWFFQGIASLLGTRQSTLMDLSRLFTDDVFREHVVRQVKDPIALRFWHKEFASYDQRFRAEATSPILNKVGQFSASPNLRAILGQVAPKFDLVRHEQWSNPHSEPGEGTDRGAGGQSSWVAAGVTLAACRHGAEHAFAGSTAAVLCSC
jgi:hypothetical protein